MLTVLGINDEVTTCECCGRSGLKRTVVLQTEAGGEVRYGVDCAAKATGRRPKSISALGLAQNYARKWAALGRAAEDIARVIRVQWCDAWVENGTVIIGQ